MTQDRKVAGGGQASPSGSSALTEMQRKLHEQSRRIEALATGREESMQVVERLKAELALVSAERDKLRKALTQVENMQTETVALTEDELADFAIPVQAPSIDELMSNITGDDTGPLKSHSTLSVESGDGEEYQEMISPEAIVLGSTRDRDRNGVERHLILMDIEGPVRFPLDQELLTIGRSDSADIQIEGDFVSRIHSRILRIGMDSVLEDAGSKNGTRVNSELVQRHVLKHGDLIRIGSVALRYMDSASGTGFED